jgi:hypothetical protein
MCSAKALPISLRESQKCVARLSDSTFIASVAFSRESPSTKGSQTTNAVSFSLSILLRTFSRLSEARPCL